MTGKPPRGVTGVQLDCVYVIHNPRTGFHKIGSARRPTFRLAWLRREMRAAFAPLHTIATNHAY